MFKLLYVPDVKMCLIIAEHGQEHMSTCVRWARVRERRDVLICTFDT